MRFDIVTLFPQFIETYLSQGVLKQGLEDKRFEVHTHDLRQYGLGNYKQVDDRPFGGGAGMLLMFEPIKNVIADIKAEYAAQNITNFKVIATSASGETYKQSIAKTLGEHEALIILCGRYEGFDERILSELVDVEISIGNYVLTGGEIPALVIVDSIGRLLPGVLNKAESFAHDSFYEDDISKQYPQFTRPETIDHEGKTLTVPPVLLSGNHAEIEDWRNKNRKQ